MVEITRIYRRKSFALLLPLLFAAGWMCAQPPTADSRAARLESDSEYLRLIEEDKALQVRQDSITHVMEELRSRLRANPAERNQLSNRILELEMQIFEIRSAKGRLVDRINELEQNWVMAQFEGADTLDDRNGWPEAPAVSPRLLSRGPKVRNLVYNNYFRDNLPAEDYAALLEAQRQELQAVGLVNRYFANYDTLTVFARNYETVATEEEAVALQDRIEALQRVNAVMADSLAAVWNYIFDNKSYAYGYVLDKLNRDQLLEAQESRLSEAMLELAALRGKTASDQVADYFLRKQAAVASETEVAKLLELDAACDSLQQVAAQLKSVDFRVPRIAVKERYFIDYEDIIFATTPKYTTQHPIPECKIYERGTVYRILLGRFSAKRAASLFKGAYPLSYRIDEERKWNYYAGGFATRAEAEAAQQLLKEHGFIRPEIVVWTNGEARNLSQEGDEQGYRVEIAQTEQLSQAVREAIAAVAGENAEISKIGQNLYIVGMFHDRTTAEAVADAIRQADDRLQPKVTEALQ